MNHIIQALHNKIYHIEVVEKALQKNISTKDNCIFFFPIASLVSFFISGLMVISIKDGYFPLFRGICNNICLGSVLIFITSLVGVGIGTIFKFGKKYEEAMSKKIGKNDKIQDLANFLKDPFNQKAILTYLDNAGLSNEGRVRYFKIKLAEQNYTLAAQWIISDFCYWTRPYTQQQQIEFLETSLSMLPNKSPDPNLKNHIDHSKHFKSINHKENIINAL
jgi:hypothetical protein